VQLTVTPELWSTTVLVGNPLARIDGDVGASRDATSELFDGEPLPSRERLTAARRRLAQDPHDLRLAAAVRFATAADARDPEVLRSMADLAREIGHDIGEAHCLMAWADVLREKGDDASLSEALLRTTAVLKPLRNSWKPAFEAHARLMLEIQHLDPTYRARRLESVRLSSGLTINDRSDPAVNAILSMQEAIYQHEAFWRGAPRLHQPDLDLHSAAHNAVVWGYLHNLYSSGAEASYCAFRST